MEKLFTLEYGVGGVCVLLTFSLFIKVAEFLWGIKEKKDKVSEGAILDLTRAMAENTLAIKHLEIRLEHLDNAIAEVPKIKIDIKRFYAALKEISGEKWVHLRDEILKDDFVL